MEERRKQHQTLVPERRKDWRNPDEELGSTQKPEQKEPNSRKKRGR